MTRPTIGITIGYDPKGERAFFLRLDYVRSVEKAGGLPLVLAPGRPADAPDLLRHLDGLMMTGGSDLDPVIYGEERHESVKRVIRERDEFEVALCREALDRDLPILAICRGQQVLNVACGGTLVQDIPSQIIGSGDHDPDVVRWETAHEVRVLPGTRLRDILAKETVAVNSFHHQAVKEVGRGLAVSARSIPDQVVEGIEAPARRFVVGVQWHPEAFWDRPDGFHALFDALVGASGR